MKLLSSAVRSMYTVALATVIGGGLLSTTLGAYRLCAECDCHTEHDSCAEDHFSLCGAVGEECFTHEGSDCEYVELNLN